MKADARQVALIVLQHIEQGRFADASLHQALQRQTLEPIDYGLVTELVYGVTRRRRTLDTLIQHFTSRQRDRHPLKIQLILRLGFYQLCYLDQIPASAAVNTSVELAKTNGFRGLAGFVNGMLRQYIRSTGGDRAPTSSPSTTEPVHPNLDFLVDGLEPVARLGILHSYPDWIVQVWIDQLGLDEAEQLCLYLNQPPAIHLRINPLVTSRDRVQTALEAEGIPTQLMRGCPQGLCLDTHVGAIARLPGYAEGEWSVQDGSAQLVSELLNPQAGDTVIDVCAAPGGKTTHITELMGDRGQVWACDRNAKRLKRLQENLQRLRLHSIRIHVADMRTSQPALPQADRVLVDAPCSGLGTLHRHADARWRQTPENIVELAALQGELLSHAAQRVKPRGVLVYATCTLHPLENESVVNIFLNHHPEWAIDAPTADSNLTPFLEPEGWLKVWPHQYDMDGFFMVRLRQGDRPINPLTPDAHSKT